jgi:hypothetical protein
VRSALTSPGAGVLRRRRWLDATAERWRTRLGALMASRSALRIVGVLVAVQLVHVTVSMAIVLVAEDRTSRTYVLYDTGLASAIGVVLVLAGAYAWRRGNVRSALRSLEGAVLIQLLYTQLFIFERQQLAGIFGFVAGLFVLGTVRAARAADVAREA